MLAKSALQQILQGMKLKSQNSNLERETNSNSEIQIIEKNYNLIEVFRGIIRIKFDCSNISEKG